MKFRSPAHLRLKGQKRKKNRTVSFLSSLSRQVFTANGGNSPPPFSSRFFFQIRQRLHYSAWLRAPARSQPGQVQRRDWRGDPASNGESRERFLGDMPSLERNVADEWRLGKNRPRRRRRGHAPVRRRRAHHLRHGRPLYVYIYIYVI